MSFRFPSESPAEIMAYNRRLRAQGTFLLSILIPLFFAITGMPWLWVVIFSALSAFSGIPTFTIWITERRWARNLARAGAGLRPRLITLVFTLGAAILLQGIVGMTLGTWPATALAPVVYAVEFLIARERVGTPATEADKR
ncbi:hypothetical protein ACIG47_03200 [Promicromonospora sp. NPDC052451]|uniref:hypothetical protein n=1 Tax=Promicromonospora sp. NPDC052451 TaxID=3364407 RepID=UPI0037C60BA0